MTMNRIALLLVLASTFTTSTNAFVAPKPRLHVYPASQSASSSITTVFAVEQQQQQQEQNVQQNVPTNTTTDADVERLRAMAAKYRAEAAALEAERGRQLAAAAEKAFAKFDRNDDGEVSLSELKQGLEQLLKTELPDERVEILMRKFDTTGDGKLQLEELVGMERFKTALAELAQEEKRRSIELQRIAKLEQEAYNEISEILNDKPPTNVEKVLSVLPYAFPLLDSLPYASFLVLDNPENPVTQLIASAYFIYRSVPLSGFIAALSLSFLSGIPRINRLIRFNMLQAIYLDIALFVPGLISILVGGASQLTGQQVPLDAVATASNVLFFASLSAILYASASSLAGQEPDKIPVVSTTVKRLLPTVEMMKEWMDEIKENDDTTEKK
jgi:hypothetical protein